MSFVADAPQTELQSRANGGCIGVPESELLTTAEVAELLGITASRVRQLIEELDVEKIKRGRDLYIRRSDLWRFETRPGMGRPPKSEK